MADISVVDEGGGANNLSMSGFDADLFEIVGGSLYIRAGTILEYDSQSVFNVSINVDDPTIGTSPDATTSFTLTITEFIPPPYVSFTTFSQSGPEGTTLEIAAILDIDSSMTVTVPIIYSGSAGSSDFLGPT